MKKLHWTQIEPAEPAGVTPDGVAVRVGIDEDLDGAGLRLEMVEISAGAQTAYHDHPWEHAVYVLEGSGIVRDVDGQVTGIGPGDIVYIPSGESHQFAHSAGATLRLVTVEPSRALSLQANVT